MESATTWRDALAPAAAQTVDSAHHPVARRISDVLRSRSEKPRVFIVDDPENIGQAVSSGVELDSLFLTTSADPMVLNEIDPDVPRYILNDNVARTLFGDLKRSRVFALGRAPKRPRLHDLTGSSGDIIVLDGVRILGNIGAITRTACALGAAGVVVVDSGLRTAWDRRLIRASRGLVFASPVVLTTRTEFIRFVRQERLTVATLSADSVEPLSSIRAVKERLALVMGSERDGASPELDALTTYRYAVPMASQVESLNVSVASGIALYEHTTG